MEQQEMQEERRARNFVWAAAEQYGLEPLFLAYAPDGTADMYLNIIIGLSYKWYDAQKLETFFHMLGGRQEELYQGMLWIGLEQALYEKEQAHRPALTDLRQEYAQENLGRYRSFKEYELIDQLRNGHCAAILGQDSGLSGRMEELLQELTFTGDMEIEQIIARMKVILWKYFSYEPKPVKKERGTYFLQKLLPAFHSIGKMHATYVKTKRYDDPVWEESGNGGTMERARHYLFQFSRQGDGEKDRAYIEGCFGSSICSPGEEKLMEEELCTENHKNSHIYITEGYSKASSPAGERWNEKAAETEKTVECGAQSALGNGMPPAISAHTVQHGVQRGNICMPLYARKGIILHRHAAVFLNKIAVEIVFYIRMAAPAPIGFVIVEFFDHPVHKGMKHRIRRIMRDKSRRIGKS